MLATCNWAYLLLCRRCGGCSVGLPDVAPSSCAILCVSLMFLVVSQGVKWQSAEERKADALAAAQGFAYHIQDAIRNTPAEGVSRNRIMDRCMHIGA